MTGQDDGDRQGPGMGLCSRRDLGPGLQELVSPICSVELPAVETNMVMVQVDGMPPEELCQRLQTVSAEEVAQTGHAMCVLLLP